jgi:hypothetical protein
MKNLTLQRCLNHERREAAARCPRCAGFFCRECVAEHDDQLVCARCLKLWLAAPEAGGPGRVRLARLAAAAAGLLLAWMLFYAFGYALLSIDTKVHDGTIWKPEDSRR